MTKRPFDSQPIGELDVYQEQISCASDIMKVFYRNGGPPLLVAQMQQGKTGVIVCVVDQFIKYCEKSKHKYEVIYLTNITDNMLKDQNVERLLVAGLLSRVKVIQHGDLKGGAFVKDSTVDVRLIIIDECHSSIIMSRTSTVESLTNHTSHITNP
jgi:superfamily II DNA or RNA helicase